MDFKFPDVGEGITEGELVKWRVVEGQQIKSDDVLAEVETDKAIVEIPSPVSGKIAKLHYKEGDNIKVGTVMVTIDDVVAGAVGQSLQGSSTIEGKMTEKTKTTIEPIQQAPKEHKSTSVVGEIEEAPEGVVAKPEFLCKDCNVALKSRAEFDKHIETHISETKVIQATPAVRKLAKDAGVDLASIEGTGTDGRITEDDVKKASEQRKAHEEQIAPHTKSTTYAGMKAVKKYDMWGYIEHIPLKGMRKSIAKNMVKSKYTAPHVTHTDEADVTHLVKIREQEKEKLAKEGIKLTYLPFIVKAVIAALKKHPYVNASLNEDDTDNQEIVLKKYYNIGIAVDTPDGLIVPVIKGADKKAIPDLAKEIPELAQKAAARKLDLMDMKGGTFTITNVGVIGGIFATPIINYPEVAILATGAIRDKVVITGDSKGVHKLSNRKILPLSLSFDHRVVDGAEAARFMNSVIEHLEDPHLFLVEE